MDNYADLIRAMADAFIAAVRDLETENAQLRAELDQLKERAGS
jgi:cell division septum initiation protein DivIVA